jgi:hypothetical protein
MMLALLSKQSFQRRRRRYANGLNSSPVGTFGKK